MRRYFAGFASLATALSCLLVADRALGVTIEDFDSPTGPDGRILYDAAPVYDGIEDSEAVGLVGGDDDGHPFFLNGIVDSGSNNIFADQSGSGFFLHHRTFGDFSVDYAGEVWGTISAVSVLPDTDYTLSFYLTNEITFPGTVAAIQPFINGTAVGSAVSAAGTFGSGGWRKFSFLWSSSAATSADLSLRNLTSTGSGNDFGIDTIELSLGAPTPVPEPSTLTLTALIVLAIAASGRRPSRPRVRETVR